MLTFFKLTFSKNYQSVKMFGSKSYPMFYRSWSWSKLFSKQGHPMCPCCKGSKSTNEKVVAGRERVNHYSACNNTCSGGSRWGSCPPPPIKTRARSRWGTIANPHAKVFDPPPPSSPNSHPGNGMKILLNMFSIFYLWEHTQSLE